MKSRDSPELQRASSQHDQQLLRQLPATQRALGGCARQLVHQPLEGVVAHQDIGDASQDEQAICRTGRGRGGDTAAAM